MRSPPLLIGLDAHRRRRDGIPRERYSSDYFLSDRCEGFEVFQERRGISWVKERFLERIDPKPGERLLEIGCGRGELLLACAGRGARAVGLDYARDAVRLSQATCGEAAKVLQADATSLPFAERSFDKVFLGDVLEHLTLEQAHAMLREAHRVLRPGGRLVLHTSPNVLFIRLVFPWVMAGLVAVGRLRLVRLLADQYRVIREFHVREYSHGRLRRLLRASPFAAVEVELSSDVLRAGQSRYTASLAGNALVRKLAALAGRQPLVRILSNDLWASARRES